MDSVIDDLNGRVSPFGNLRIKVRLPTPRSLSQASTSFFACNRQGIHHVHLVACLYNFDFSFENPVIQLSFFAVSKAIAFLEITSYTFFCNHYPSDNLRLLLIIGFFLLYSRLLKNFYYLRSLKDQIKPLSFSKRFDLASWWRLTGSNRRPPACKAGALPAELNPHSYMVGLVGLEPTTPALSTRCSNQLSYRPFWISISAYRSYRPDVLLYNR